MFCRSARAARRRKNKTCARFGNHWQQTDTDRQTDRQFGRKTAGALSVQPAAPHRVAPVAVLRRHTYYDVTYCMRELSALHVR